MLACCGVFLLQHTLLREGLSAKDERLVMRARYRLISYRREIAPLSVPLLQKVKHSMTKIENSLLYQLTSRLEVI